MPRKQRAEGTRAPNMAASIYQDQAGRWHGRVSMGVRDDGKPDRRHVSATTEAEVIRKVRALERDRDAGRARKPGRAPTVQAWLEHWLEHIAKPSIRPNSYDAYRVAVVHHLAPGIGAHRLDKLAPEHLEKLYAKMLVAGAKPARVHQVHRTIRTALNVAKRRGLITGNVATLAKAPRIDDEDEIEPYTVEEIQRILRQAGKARNSARWAIALSLGLRQGEVLGLRWEDVDLGRGIIKVRRSRLRPKYAHGCPGNCGKKAAGYCPDRKQTRSDTSATKSKAGRRNVGLPAELAMILQQHAEKQRQERGDAAQLWEEGGWVFTTVLGRPINPRTDWSEWKTLAEAAGVRDLRLHDARHTAATVLLLLGVPERAVMGLMGWSSTAMAAKYQHITQAVRDDVADRVGDLIWSKP